MFQAITNEERGNVALWQSALPHLKEYTAFGMIAGTTPKLVRGIIREIEELLRNHKNSDMAPLLTHIEEIFAPPSVKDFSFLMVLGTGTSVSFYIRGDVGAYFIEPRGVGYDPLVTDLSFLWKQNVEGLQWISGDVSQGKILFLTGVPSELIGHEELARFVSGHDNGLWIAKQTVVQKDPDAAFALVLCGKEVKRASASEASMRELLGTAARTEAVLESPLRHVTLPLVGKWFGTQTARVAKSVHDIQSAIIQMGKEVRKGYERMRVPRKTTTANPKSLSKSKAVSLEEVLDFSKPIEELISASRPSVFDRFNRLPFMTKWLLLGTVAGVFLFAESIFILRYQKNQADLVSAYRSRLEAIGQRVDDAHAGVLYGNESQSRILIGQAEQELKDLRVEPLSLWDPRIPEQTGLKDLDTRIQAVKDELRHAVMVTTPLKITMLPDGITAQNSDLFMIQQNLYLRSGSNVRRWNAVRTRWDPLPPLPAGVTHSSTDGAGNVALLEQGATFTIWDLVAGKEVAKGPLPALLIQAIYNQRPYVVTTDGSVMRYDGTAWRLWLKDPQHYPDASSLLIDGDVYLGRNQEVIRLRSGRKQAFSLASIDPPLQGPGRLVVVPDSTFLYWIESTPGRLTVFRKDNGALVTQYMFSSTLSPATVSVDEKNKKIYFVVGGALYSTPLNQGT